MNKLALWLDMYKTSIGDYLSKLPIKTLEHNKNKQLDKLFDAVDEDDNGVTEINIDFVEEKEGENGTDYSITLKRGRTYYLNHSSIPGYLSQVLSIENDNEELNIINQLTRLVIHSYHPGEYAITVKGSDGSYSKDITVFVESELEEGGNYVPYPLGNGIMFDSNTFNVYHGLWSEFLWTLNGPVYNDYSSEQTFPEIYYINDPEESEEIAGINELWDYSDEDNEDVIGIDILGKEIGTVLFVLVYYDEVEDYWFKTPEFTINVLPQILKSNVTGHPEKAIETTLNHNLFGIGDGSNTGTTYNFSNNSTFVVNYDVTPGREISINLEYYEGSNPNLSNINTTIDPVAKTITFEFGEVNDNFSFLIDINGVDWMIASHIYNMILQ